MFLFGIVCIVFGVVSDIIARYLNLDTLASLPIRGYLPSVNLPSVNSQFINCLVSSQHR